MPSKQRIAKSAHTTERNFRPANNSEHVALWSLAGVFLASCSGGGGASIKPIKGPLDGIVDLTLGIKNSGGSSIVGTRPMVEEGSVLTAEFNPKTGSSQTPTMTDLTVAFSDAEDNLDSLLETKFWAEQVAEDGMRSFVEITAAQAIRTQYGNINFGSRMVQPDNSEVIEWSYAPHNLLNFPEATDTIRVQIVDTDGNKTDSAITITLPPNKPPEYLADAGSGLVSVTTPPTRIEDRGDSILFRIYFTDPDTANPQLQSFTYALGYDTDGSATEESDGIDEDEFEEVTTLGNQHFQTELGYAGISLGRFEEEGRAAASVSNISWKFHLDNTKDDVIAPIPGRTDDVIHRFQLRITDNDPRGALSVYIDLTVNIDGREDYATFTEGNMASESVMSSSTTYTVGDPEASGEFTYTDPDDPDETGAIFRKIPTAETTSADGIDALDFSSGSAEVLGTYGTFTFTRTDNTMNLDANDDGVIDPSTLSWTYTTTDAGAIALAGGRTMTDTIFIATQGQFAASVESVATISVEVTGANAALTLETNTGATINQGQTNLVLTTEHLFAADVDTPADQITYGVIWVPANGVTLHRLDENGVPGARLGSSAQAPSVFTQQDLIDRVIILQQDVGVSTNLAPTRFRFTVNDGTTTLDGDDVPLDRRDTMDNLIIFPITIQVAAAPRVAWNYNNLDVAKGGSVVIPMGSLRVVDTEQGADALTYTITNQMNGEVRWADGSGATTSFTQADINAGSIFFMHDDSEITETVSFDFSVSDGVSATPATGTFTLTPLETADANHFPIFRPQTIDERVTVTIPNEASRVTQYNLTLRVIESNLTMTSETGDHVFTFSDSITASANFLTEGYDSFPINTDEDNGANDLDSTDRVIEKTQTRDHGTFTIIRNNDDGTLTVKYALDNEDDDLDTHGAGDTPLMDTFYLRIRDDGSPSGTSTNQQLAAILVTVEIVGIDEIVAPVSQQAVGGIAEEFA